MDLGEGEQPVSVEDPVVLQALQAMGVLQPLLAPFDILQVLMLEECIYTRVKKVCNLSSEAASLMDHVLYAPHVVPRLELLHFFVKGEEPLAQMRETMRLAGLDAPLVKLIEDFRGVRIESDRRARGRVRELTRATELHENLRAALLNEDVEAILNILHEYRSGTKGMRAAFERIDVEHDLLQVAERVFHIQRDSPPSSSTSPSSSTTMSP